MSKVRKTYTDKVKCPEGHKFWLTRRIGTAGKIVGTYCQQCRRSYRIKAGTVPIKKESQQ